MFLVDEAFDSVFDKGDAEEEQDALVDQIYDEIGLEFSESVNITFLSTEFYLLLGQSDTVGFKAQFCKEPIKSI